MVTDNNRHYTVRGRSNGKLYSDEFVFDSKEEVVKHGEHLKASHIVREYCLVVTTAPINRPPHAD